jgi:hypothetical protein
MIELKAYASKKFSFLVCATAGGIRLKHESLKIVQHESSAMIESKVYTN